MNGWGAAEPAWWLNLSADPVGVVDVPGQSFEVRARVAEGDERTRLWSKLTGGTWGDIDGYAAKRSRETPVVVFERSA